MQAEITAQCQGTPIRLSKFKGKKISNVRFVGEYLVAYTYTRLLAGERLIYVIPDNKERQELKRYIRKRLNKLTRSQEECTWRVYTSDERLDQADVLIASPEDCPFAGLPEICTDLYILNLVILYGPTVSSILTNVDNGADLPDAV